MSDTFLDRSLAGIVKAVTRSVVSTVSAAMMTGYADPPRAPRSMIEAQKVPCSTSTSSSALRDTASAKTAEKRTAIEEAWTTAKRSRRDAHSDHQSAIHSLIRAPEGHLRSAYNNAKLRRLAADTAAHDAVLVSTAADANFNITRAEIIGIDSIVRTRGIQKIVDAPAASSLAVTPKAPAASTLKVIDYSKADADEIRATLSDAKRRCVAAVAAKKQAEVAVAAKKAMQQLAIAQEQGVKDLMRARGISEHPQTDKARNKAKAKTAAKAPAKK